MEGLKLYQPRTIVPEFPHRGRLYKDVQITWLVQDRQEPIVLYEESIKGYRRLEDSNKFYAEQSLQELFTELELKQLQEYLLLVHDDTDCLVEVVSLPLASKSFPLSGIPVGSSSDWYELHREPEYALPFKVMGFFDVAGYEVIGQSEPEPAEHAGQDELAGFLLYESGDLFPIPTAADIAIHQRAALYTELGLSSEQVLFLEALELQH